MTIIKPEILKLREEMSKEGIDVFFVQSGDPHNSEFVNKYYDTVRYLSGFTGENATLIVTEEDAYLWVDGRFFIQAEKELANTGITLMKMGEPGVPEVSDYLDKLASEFDFTLGFDGNTTNTETGMALDDLLFEYGIDVTHEHDLVSRIWDDREAICPSEIYELPFESVGMTAEEKLIQARFAMDAADADYMLISDLMEVAWLTNLRGADIDYTPVYFGYILISKFDAKLYVMEGALSDEIKAQIERAGYTVCDYSEIEDAIASIPANATLYYSPSSTSYTLSLSLKDGVGIIEETTPIELMKAIKNPNEIESTIEAHKKDGVAVTTFIAWLKEQREQLGGNYELTELDASNYLKECRFNQDKCFDLSFETIAAYGPNAAIIHYMPGKQGNAKLESEGFLLVDSGGQYLDGTTDITRTIAMGPLTCEEKRCYTLVLKSHIAMLTYKFDKNAYGKEIDAHARQPLNDAGLDFNHGLGHGIGHVLGVHENPNVLGRRAENQHLYPGMIMSDEPGVYIEDKFGIRIENELVVRDLGDKLGFESITFVPYEREAIMIELLSAEEIEWINSYHKKIRETLLPRLTDALTIDYLLTATLPIAK